MAEVAHPFEPGAGPDRGGVLLAACGIAGPVLYTAVVIVLGVLRPGYDHFTQLASELGESGAPYAIVMNASFFLFGLLLIAFAFGLYRGMSDRTGLKVGSALLVFGGIGFLGAAFFPCSPGCGLDTSASHFLASSPGLGLYVAPLVFYGSWRKDNQWRRYGSYSLLTGVLAILLLVTNFSSLMEPWDGVGQRLQDALVFPWIVIMAIFLLRQSLRTSRGGAPLARRRKPN